MKSRVSILDSFTLKDLSLDEENSASCEPSENCPYLLQSHNLTFHYINHDFFHISGWPRSIFFKKISVDFERSPEDDFLYNLISYIEDPQPKKTIDLTMIELHNWHWRYTSCLDFGRRSRNFFCNKKFCNWRKLAHRDTTIIIHGLFKAFCSSQKGSYKNESTDDLLHKLSSFLLNFVQCCIINYHIIFCHSSIVTTTVLLLLLIIIIILCFFHLKHE